MNGIAESDPFTAVPALSRAILGAMRNAIPAVAEQITIAIASSIPEYQWSLRGPEGDSLRRVVWVTLECFVDLVADPYASRKRLRELAISVGVHEAGAGRDMHDHGTALNLACRIGRNNLSEVVRSLGEPMAIEMALADAIYEYRNYVTELTYAAYNDTGQRTDAVRALARARLLRALAGVEPMALEAITAVADRAGWPLPDLVTPVALRIPARLADSAAVGDSQVLANLRCEEPHLVIPGTVTSSRLAELVTAPGCQVAVGLPVAPRDAAESLAEARALLALAADHVIWSRRVIWCEDHLPDLLLGHSLVARALAGDYLARLAAVSGRDRDKMFGVAETWFDRRNTNGRVAQRHHVNEKTVRNWAGKVTDALGAIQDDPDSLLKLAAALRLLRMERERSARLERLGDDARPAPALSSVMPPGR